MGRRRDGSTVLGAETAACLVGIELNGDIIPVGELVNRGGHSDGRRVVMAAKGGLGSGAAAVGFVEKGVGEELAWVGRPLLDEENPLAGNIFFSLECPVGCSSRDQLWFFEHGCG